MTFKIDMNHMGTDALKKSYYLAHSRGNVELVKEIEGIFRARGVDIPKPGKLKIVQGTE